MSSTKEDKHEFAKETAMLQLGQDLPPPKMYRVVEAAEPLPDLIVVALSVEQGPSAPNEYPMSKPIVVLGRVEDVADVPVADPAASRYHACVSHRDGKFLLSDMGSTNGTFVNGEPAGEVELNDGDEIKIGESVIRFTVAARE